MTKQLAQTANSIFSHMTKARTNPDYPGKKFYIDTAEMDLENVRDYCDMRTGAELDCFQLDMLADMVTKRLINKEHSDNPIDCENVYNSPSIAQSIAEDL